MAAGDHSIFCGTVFAKVGGKVFKKRHLLATCGGIENQPAKLELFKCDEGTTSKANATKLLEISFCKVTSIHCQLTEDNKQSIVLTINDGRRFSFYSELDTEMKSWTKYCLTLQKIPNYSIPELPKTKSLKLGKCSDTVKRSLNALSAYEVFILNTGVGCVLNYSGKHFITLHNEDKTDASFRINSFHTKKCLHEWSKSELRSSQFGHIDSMVYLEIPRHGLLWMYCCPDTLALELNEIIHKFMSHDKSTSDPSSVDYCHTIISSYDSGIGSSSSSYQNLDEMPETTNTINSYSKHQLTSQSSVESSLSPLLHSYADGHGQHNYDDLNHTPDQGHFSDTKTTGGYTDEMSTMSFPPMNSDNAYKGSSTRLNQYSLSRQHKRKPSSPCLPMKKQMCFQSLPPNFIQEFKDCRVELDSHWEKQRCVLWKCCPVIRHCLDITAILPYLMSEDLITNDDHDVLRNEIRPRNDKIHHLIAVLPRKSNLFEKFLNCLYQSSNGTAHAEIARQLEENIDYY